MSTASFRNMTSGFSPICLDATVKIVHHNKPVGKVAGEMGGCPPCPQASPRSGRLANSERLLASLSKAGTVYGSVRRVRGAGSAYDATDINAQH